MFFESKSPDKNYSNRGREKLLLKLQMGKDTRTAQGRVQKNVSLPFGICQILEYVFK